MWRQVQLARKAAILSGQKTSAKFHALQNRAFHQPSQVLHNSCYQIFSSHSLESSSLLAKWVIGKPVFFQHLRHFSSDPSLESTDESPLVERNQTSDFDVRFNLEENPSSESVEYEPTTGESWDNFGIHGGENEEFSGENEDTIGENETRLGESEGEVEEVLENDAEKVENLLSLLQSSAGDADRSLDNSLENMRLVLNEAFVLRVLQTPFVPGENLIGFYSWCLKKPEFSATTQTLGVLVTAICSEMQTRSAYDLWDLLKEVGEKEKGALSTAILNELISLFSRLAKGKVAFEVFDNFEVFGCVPDADTYYYTMEALCRRSRFDLATSVLEKMLTMQMLPDAEKVGKLISYFCKGKRGRDAHSVYLTAKEKNISPPRSSVNHLIGALCFLPKKDKASIREDADKIYNENIYLALKMLEGFSGEDRNRAVKPFSSVTQALCKIGDVEKAEELLFKMIEVGPPPGNAIFNAIINGFSKAGDIEEAKRLLKVMEDRGLKPDVYTYSVIMSGCTRGGAVEEARKVLDEAKKKHAKLTPVTYHTLIRGYCKLGQFDEAVKLFAEMKDYGVRPSADEYNKLVQSLCLKALDWGMAEKLVQETNEEGLHLNGLTKSLITAVKELEKEGGDTQEETAAV